MLFFIVACIAGSTSVQRTPRPTRAVHRWTSAPGAAPATTAAPGSRRSSDTSTNWSSVATSSSSARSKWSLRLNSFNSSSRSWSSNKTSFTGGSEAWAAVGSRSRGGSGVASQPTRPPPRHTTPAGPDTDFPVFLSQNLPADFFQKTIMYFQK